ncbi:MAG: 2-amino-4-hydroxy-6-hydroxymethyldihydropteridine diphosphokinase [Thermogutta sp.]|nr:2-amino-4-hydroxy-6-hydroxymethyldihydropteridine diphosphokinase [Thermogutta sp.]
MATVLIGLGSNLGDRHATLSRALDILSGHASITVATVSNYREYPPAGGDISQLPFLNAAALLHTSLAPIEVLRVLQETEERLGRKRGERWGPRTLDLDILLFDDLVQVTSDLTIPHPRLAGRIFALEPAIEIAPGQVHPVCGMTLAAILAHLRGVPPWIALAPAGFGACVGAFPSPDDNAFQNAIANESFRAYENAAAQVATECAALLRSRSRQRTLPSGLAAVVDYRFVAEDAVAPPTIDAYPTDKIRMPEATAKLQDAPEHESRSVLITATWKSVYSRLSSASKPSASPAEGPLPRLVILGPDALPHLPEMSYGWRVPKESQAASDDESSDSRSAPGVGAERIVARLRHEIESCRGRVPMVLVESQDPQSVIKEVAGIVEGAVQPDFL